MTLKLEINKCSLILKNNSLLSQGTPKGEACLSAERVNGISS